MTRYALVLSTEDEIIVGLINKNGAVENKERGLPSDNPRDLPVKSGSVVIVDENKKVQAIRGIISLLFPVSSSVAGYFAASFLSSLFKKSAGEISKAVFVLIFLSISASLVFLASRMGKIRGRPQIVDIIQTRRSAGISKEKDF